MFFFFLEKKNFVAHILEKNVVEKINLRTFKGEELLY